MIQQNLKPMTVSADTQLGGNVKPQNSNAQNLGNTLDRTYSVLEKMKTLSLQDPNDENTQNEQQKLQQEVNQLASEVSKLANASESRQIWIDRLEKTSFPTFSSGEYIREGATLSGVTLSTASISSQANIGGDLLYCIESGIYIENTLIEGTDISIYVNNNKYKEDIVWDDLWRNDVCYYQRNNRKVVMEPGQCAITGKIQKGDGTNIICDSYVFSPKIDTQTGNVIFNAYGISFSITKEDFYYILNSKEGKKMYFRIYSGKQLLAGSMLSTDNIAHVDNELANSIQIYGPDNFTSFIIDIDTIGFSPNIKIDEIQIQYSLANGTSVIDRISNNNGITSYFGAGGVEIHFNITESIYSGIKLETVNQLVKAGARRKYKMYKLL